MPDAHGEERRIREAALDGPGGGKVVRVQLILASVDVDDEELAFVARFDFGPHLVVVVRLAAPHDLAAGKACRLHSSISSLLPRSARLGPFTSTRHACRSCSFPWVPYVSFVFPGLFVTTSSLDVLAGG